MGRLKDLWKRESQSENIIKPIQAPKPNEQAEADPLQEAIKRNDYLPVKILLNGTERRIQLPVRAFIIDYSDPTQYGKTGQDPVQVDNVIKPIEPKKPTANNVFYDSTPVSRPRILKIPTGDRNGQQYAYYQCELKMDATGPAITATQLPHYRENEESTVRNITTITDLQTEFSR